MRNDDLISRAAAIKAFTGKPPEYYHTSYIVSELNDIPVMDAAPVVHGHWIIYPDVCVCSECNEQSPGIFKYCPNCGALIDEEAKEGWD